MEKRANLKDGTQVLIRPMRKDDLERSYTFFQGLPDEDREYLRGDVTKRPVVAQRISAMRTGKVKRLVALVDDRIVADGALELEPQAWKEHVGELRLIVAHDYQRRGLGVIMAHELYALAAGSKVEEVIVKIMRPQVGALGIFHKLGFRDEATLPGYVKDVHGRRHDLIVMRCDLAALWEKMENLVEGLDWRHML